MKNKFENDPAGLLKYIHAYNFFVTAVLIQETCVFLMFAAANGAVVITFLFLSAIFLLSLLVTVWQSRSTDCLFWGVLFLITGLLNLLVMIFTAMPIFSAIHLLFLILLINSLIRVIRQQEIPIGIFVSRQEIQKLEEKIANTEPDFMKIAQSRERSIANLFMGTIFTLVWFCVFMHTLYSLCTCAAEIMETF